MKTQTNYTPGPWQANVWGAGDWTVSAPNAHYSVCHLVDCNNAEANARLIALAPEMAEALRIFSNQSIGSDWTAEQAVAFIRKEARSLLARISNP